MTTLKDISRRLGLSVTQVSRALNGHDDVNAETRERVAAAARAMNYHPNMTARKLVSGRSGMVGLVIPKYKGLGSDAMFMEVVAGLSAQFSSREMQFVLHIMEESEPAIPVYQRLVGRGALDGFVLIDPHNDDPRVTFLQSAGLPFVVHGRPSAKPDFPFFDIENEKLLFELTTYLASAGHRRIALLNGLVGRPYVSHRTRGFANACEAAGIPPQDRFERHGDMDAAHGLVSTVGLFNGPGPRPTAIICGNVRIAHGVYQALASLRLSIPQDVSVVAHDDHLPDLRASAFFPSLTVTKAPLRESWKPMADCLAGAIDGLPLAELQQIGAYEFIARNSVAPPAG
ncbi:MAG: substrate-binding domain-containing protein [Rhodobacteraceae bacterium]|jgi:LacI family transcriptional regulator|nr:substrate-binding domain-containing protein [Paracoccaceae bacterium]